MLIVVYPVAEELVFRGLMQDWVRNLPWGQAQFVGITCANGITSVLFVGCHFFSHPPLAAASVLAPSLVFGYFRDRYSGQIPMHLLSPMLLHVWYNAGYFLLFWGG